jgi:hypothetical protein
VECADVQAVAKTMAKTPDVVRERSGSKVFGGGVHDANLEADGV